MQVLLLSIAIILALFGCDDSYHQIQHDSKDQDMANFAIDESVIVSKESIESDDPYDVIWSNISFLNALKEEHFRNDELSQDALRSYYVDYYLAQVNNGGFSQFVYNSDWSEDTVQSVRSGLQAMGAAQHYELFNESALIIDRLGPERLQEFYESQYFGTNEERDLLNQFDEKFYDLSKQEDLIELNSRWLQNLPNLVVMSVKEMKAEVERRAAALPDRVERAEEALANEPRYMKLIRALCSHTEQDLSRVTAGNPNHEFDGEQVLAWHFITDKGHHYMIDADGKAFMFHGDTHDQIASIEATDEYGKD